MRKFFECFFKSIAGIDVGKFFSEMAIILWKLNLIFSDFERALDLLKKVEKDFASRHFIVMESTRHYHKTLLYILCKNGFEVSTINPILSNSIKNIGVRKAKNDKYDYTKPNQST